MEFKRIWNEIILPLLICIIISLSVSTIECCNCITFLKTNCSYDVFGSIVQVESLLFAGVITVLTIRLNLVDNEINKNRERFNEILVKYKYYGYTLFENQFERNYNKIIEIINKKLDDSKENKFTDDYKSADLDKRNADFCFKTARTKLNNYRREHFKAIKYLIILFLLIIILSLIALHFDFEFILIVQKTIKTTIILYTIYSVYITYGALKELFNHPFTHENHDEE